MGKLTTESEGCDGLHNQELDPYRGPTGGVRSATGGQKKTEFGAESYPCLGLLGTLGTPVI